MLIHNTSFFSQLTNGFNKLECFLSDKPFQSTAMKHFGGLYYKPITIINDNSSVINQLETLLIDNARVVIYDRHVFIVAGHCLLGWFVSYEENEMLWIWSMGLFLGISQLFYWNRNCHIKKMIYGGFHDGVRHFCTFCITNVFCKKQKFLWIITLKLVILFQYFSIGPQHSNINMLR
jgi:hypothetical protein